MWCISRRLHLKLSWRSHSSRAHRISGYSASSAFFCPAAVSTAAWGSHLGAPTSDFQPEADSAPGLWLALLSQCRGLKTGQDYSIETSTFIHALLHHQSVLSWKLDRQPIDCVGVKKKKSRAVVSGESLSIYSALATHLHGRNAAQPESQILFLEAFIHQERSKLVGLHRIRLIKHQWNAK